MKVIDFFEEVNSLHQKFIPINVLMHIICIQVHMKDKKHFIFCEHWNNVEIRAFHIFYAIAFHYKVKYNETRKLDIFKR